MVNTSNIMQSVQSKIAPGKFISLAEKVVKRPIKIVFSDIDGTAWRGGSQGVYDSTVRGLQELQEANIPVVLTTGRGYKELDFFFRKFNMQPQIAIAESGAMIIDGKKNKLFEDLLSPDSVQKIREAFNKFRTRDSFLTLTFDGEHYMEGTESVYSRTHCLDSFDKLLDKGLLPTRAMLGKFDSKSFDDIEKFLEKFREFLGNKLNVCNTNIQNAEISNAHVTKAKGIEFLQKLLKFDFKNAACIGDAGNDVQMAKLISERGGISVSMGNGTEEMKKASDFITNSITEDGYYNFITTILNINSKCKLSSI